jgi:hypothetical protein
MNNDIQEHGPSTVNTSGVDANLSTYDKHWKKTGEKEYQFRDTTCDLRRVMLTCVQLLASER